MKPRNVCIRLAALVAALALALPGCARQQETAASTLPDAAATPEAAAQDAPAAPAETLQCVLFPANYVSMPPEAYPDGFYYTDTFRGYNAQGANLTYFDYAAGAQRVLCDVPGCTHDTEACVSYLPQGGIPFVAGEKLYVLALSGEMYDTVTLQQRELDGTGVQTLAKMTEVSGLDGGYYDGQSLYIVNRYDSILRVDLQNGTTEQIPWPGEDWFLQKATWQGQILAFSFEEGEGWPAYRAYRLAMVSPRDGTLTELHSWEPGACNGSFYFREGVCYYIETCTGKLMALDLAADTVREVSDAFCQYNVPRKTMGEQGETDDYPARGWYGWMAGDWLCIKEVSYDEGAGLARGAACNVVTGEARPLTLTMRSNGYEQPVWVVGETAYGLLVRQEEAPLTLHITDTEGKPYTAQTFYDVFALIDTQDYMDGVPAFRTLTPLPHADAP